MIKINQEKLKEVETKRAQQKRASAYSQEADPLAFKMLRGEITKEEWEAKIEEIRQRFPYPNE
jgi:uncharacterized membrane protein